MKFMGLQSKTVRRLKYAVYIFTAISIAAVMFYMNFKRERTLRTIQERRLLIQEQFDADPRFRGITIGIDRAMQVSTVTGVVATADDAKELKKTVTKMRPFSGTYNWYFDVDVKETRHQ